MAHPNVKDMVDELRYDLARKDLRKALIVLSYIEHIDGETQEILLSELKLGEPEFVVPMLAHLMTHQEKVCESQPIIKELMIYKLIEDPTLLTRFLCDKKIEDKSVFFQIAGEIRPEKMIPSLLEILSTSEDTGTIKLVISTLGQIADPTATNALTDYLYSGKRELVITAIRALGKVGTPTAMRRLSERMGTDNELDLLILQVFSEVQDIISLTKLIETLGSHYAHMRNFARASLVEIGEKSVPMLMENLYHDDPDMQILILNALGQIGDASAIAPIRKLLSSGSKDPNVRFAAYEALSLLPLQKGAYVLAGGLTDPVENVRVAAARAIDRNYNDVLSAGIKNMVSYKDEDAFMVVETIIVAQANKAFIDLAPETYFQDLAIKFLSKAHKDVCTHYYNLLKAHGMMEFAEKVQPKAERKVKKRKACVVDDSRMILNIYKSTLHKLGFEPILFEFPKSAIEWLENEKPDLLFTDLNMPEITGIQLTEKTRSKYSTRDLPIIMVTTQNDAQDNEAAYKAGVDKIIYKPFDAETLKGAISEFIKA
ncbi:CheY-like receiver and winged-helix DNA-binding domain-containing response regulator [uncultured Desulfobacterium sp.]|uniref:CheY-like receiver and winged-helix DNA-binding domain-containing response regulator n=1 Tax=uncultured Desulfobacterium sp. TaxID=201089 RepID=A0A445N395_9BACT|nr:CheY-like receiver and winged-helix DNA-binding domain-containing response regulator [uncultured Desulfobacterium sp.]